MGSRVLNLLLHGRENAQTARELAHILNIKPRIISRNIHNLRVRDKIVICSCNTGRNKGYFLPENDEEISHFVRSMYSRIREIAAAVAPAKKYLADRGGE